MKRVVLLVALCLSLVGCAGEVGSVEPDAGEYEPEVGALMQPLTATVTLSSVLEHLTVGTPTFTILKPVSGGTYYEPFWGKQIYWRVGDTATFPLKVGAHRGTYEEGLDAVCKALSGRKLYIMVNGSLARGINLENKLVVKQ